MLAVCHFRTSYMVLKFVNLYEIKTSILKFCLCKMLAIVEPL